MDQPADHDPTRRAWSAAGLAAGLATGLGLVGTAGLAWQRGWRVASDVLPEGQAGPLSVRFPGLPVLRLDGAAEGLPARSDRLRVLNLWARWCGPCRRELPGLGRLARRLAGQGIALQALALDDDGFALREYLRDVPVGDLPMWRMPPSRWPAELGLSSLPQTWVIGRQSDVLARWVGARDWDADGWLPRLLEQDRRDRAAASA